MVLLIINDPPFEPWTELFAEMASSLEVRCWPNMGNPGDIRYVFAWQPEPGTFGLFPNLQAVFSVGAGADGILRDPSLQDHVPIIRTLADDATYLMAEFVLMATLMLHRGFPQIAAEARDRQWITHFDQPRVSQRAVGVLGCGALGLPAAQLLARNGFVVHGWVRRRRIAENVQLLSGPDGLEFIAKQSSILVNLLPLTPETRHVIDHRLIRLMPQGSGIVNVARGEHLVEEALLAALNDGHLSGAIIDVCHDEPPPPSHTFWSHPLIMMTGHNGAVASRRARAKRVIETIRTLSDGRVPENLVDRRLGY